MRLEYYLLDPTGNITVLAATPVPPAVQPEIASQLMKMEPSAEQVGFLYGADGCDMALRMAGGEFCGNASMSAAVIAAADAGKKQGDMRLLVSGAEGSVTARVEMQTDGTWSGTVEMPKPAETEMISFPDPDMKSSDTDMESSHTLTLPAVRFEGICHVIVEEKMPRDLAEKAAPVWCRHLNADALGLMFLDREACSLTPLVYVPAAGTLCWENSCASGTTAAGAFLAGHTGLPFSISLRQPGGSLTVTVTEERTYLLSGSVRIRKHDFAEIEIPDITESE